MLTLRPVATAAMLCALAAGAAGCGGDDDEPSAQPTVSSGAPTTAAPSATPTAPLVPDVLTSGPNPGLPLDFPAGEVPVLAGEVRLPLGPGSGEGPRKGWVLELDQPGDKESCFRKAAAALTANGFTQQPGETKDAKSHEALFTAPGYGVIVSTTNADGGGCRLGYEVGELGGEPSPSPTA